ncbi:MAG TPA: UbiX family flavin prenyltransferase, partial [Streptosporangiaceae bacterium]|nr:UbiX family flavin prenyltransferase [Streptosporangiaceae bacterium]
MGERIIIGISGASGAIYGIRALQLLRAVPEVETHLIVTKAGRATIAAETAYTLGQVTALADAVYPDHDLAAPPSSGSFRAAGMLVAPCSIKTLSGIANCYDDTLLIRAADVALKERRRLVLLVRETPLRAAHLRLMTEVTSNGAIVAPPVPAFYASPRTIDDLVDHTVGRALDLFGIDTGAVRRWTGLRAVRHDRSDRHGNSPYPASGPSLPRLRTGPYLRLGTGPYPGSGPARSQTLPTSIWRKASAGGISGSPARHTTPSSRWAYGSASRRQGPSLPAASRGSTDTPTPACTMPRTIASCPVSTVIRGVNPARAHMSTMRSRSPYPGFIVTKSSPARLA